MSLSFNGETVRIECHVLRSPSPNDGPVVLQLDVKNKAGKRVAVLWGTNNHDPVAVGSVTVEHGDVMIQLNEAPYT